MLTGVSILALPEGRALPGLPSGSVPMYNVSILALPEGRALPPKGDYDMVRKAFQSSLSPKGERYLLRRWIVRRPRCFNPRSPRRESATPRTRSMSIGVIVSILALPEGRALPVVRQDRDKHCDVSILALPEGRALLT